MFFRSGIVRRLHKDSSVLMVVGKTLEAVTELVRRIAAREVHREYLALAHGRLEGEPFSIEAPIRRDPASRVKMAIGPGGREARTDVEPVACKEIEGRWISAVRCVLHTGRTHQIRVHLASRGHPLLADAVYGGAPALGLPRQALHAARLSFAHPHSGASCSFEAPLPPDLAEAWSRICDTRGD